MGRDPRDANRRSRLYDTSPVGKFSRTRCTKTVKSARQFAFSHQNAVAYEERPTPIICGAELPRPATSPARPFRGSPLCRSAMNRSVTIGALHSTGTTPVESNEQEQLTALSRLLHPTDWEPPMRVSSPVDWPLPKNTLGFSRDNARLRATRDNEVSVVDDPKIKDSRPRSSPNATHSQPVADTDSRARGDSSRRRELEQRKVDESIRTAFHLIDADESGYLDQVR